MGGVQGEGGANVEVRVAWRSGWVQEISDIGFNGSKSSNDNVDVVPKGSSTSEFADDGLRQHVNGKDNGDTGDTTITRMILIFIVITDGVNASANIKIVSFNTR